MAEDGHRLRLDRTIRELMSTPSPFDALYGLEFLSCTDDLVVGVVPVERHITQPFGLVHGGVYAAVAEALASTGTNIGIDRPNVVGVGLSNQTSFLRPIMGGHLHGTARRRHRGRTTWLWDVDITNDSGRLCATARVTVAVREV